MIITACAVVACHATAAYADPRENALHHIAQAIAGAQICDRIELNEGIVAAIAYVHGVDIARDKEEIMAQVRDHLAAMKKTSPEIGCAAALLLYGPKGLNVPDMLREK
ncbi:hypothetical protein GOZ93_16945 [Agrobacterium vitis]|uniref:hypothetical protein n=1 Tax=Rhizobium/Agrobacterium group TaxID=227290 RepID=UPI0012E8AE48|nr:MULTISPECIES: hypothetical protein [Rhizobium/Agrobacterium group]MCF1472646.1 hypothetical protein [Allorhizobium ampelinum]MUZ83919.1 hypothetical protein [Agrobacterium vitis]MVA50946.1 hypothetical protein [Agrobacterium vitis]NSZ52435.1 hypothetical protein [Agrobacterium vitis]NTA31197.1 hypothetical protein [Agrobacterium vitis]